MPARVCESRIDESYSKPARKTQCHSVVQAKGDSSMRTHQFIEKSDRDESVPFYFSSLFVERPNGKYRGQKLTKLVNKKIAPRINRINPNMPDMVPV